MTRGPATAKVDDPMKLADKHGVQDSLDLDAGVSRGRRLLGSHTTSEMRSMLIRLYRSAGKPMCEIAGALGVSVPTAHRWARVPVPSLSDSPSPRD